MNRDLQTIKSNFVKELKNATLGKKTSLPFIVHRIPSASLIENGERFQVMVIGGSVFKKALLQKTADGAEILKRGNEKHLSIKDANELLLFIEQELNDEVKTLAINFAYPLKPVFEKGKLDGVLLAVPKEGSFQDLVGKKIGEEIEGYILKKRKKKNRQSIPRGKFCQRFRASVANDTVCLLLSGLTKHKWDNLAAGIVGTGLNFAFFLNKDRLVNLESANFDKFPQTKVGKIIDKQSARKGTALFEKETAGAYLYKHFNIIVKNNKLDFPEISSTEELDSISRKNIPQTSEIALNLLEKSAQLVACQIAGVTEFKKKNQNLLKRHPGGSVASDRISSRDSIVPPLAGLQNDKYVADVVFNMEGSLFWKGNQYKETVAETVKQLAPYCKVEFVEIENSAILGAAELVA